MRLESGTYDRNTYCAIYLYLVPLIFLRHQFVETLTRYSQETKNLLKLEAHQLDYNWRKRQIRTAYSITYWEVL